MSMSPPARIASRSLVHVRLAQGRGVGGVVGGVQQYGHGGRDRLTGKRPGSFTVRGDTGTPRRGDARW